ncbi:metal ABC transporter ATP-binding protein [Vagococcus salmoninarum]|uniref:Manganese ABC transporter ATP-binding protein n=2 Tax=Vagococcus salmoninarum TaxID=2739 RepID=A0A429ZKY2_9ENTE|nr:metal ABC transporter ATP-binding protein [Vagococcus salmoninarum]RST94329.1 manganese ABC transporter ATP-binding protein [Vagococcus salmoninarum]
METYEKINLHTGTASYAGKPINVKALTVSYQGKTAIKDITLELAPGKITGIIGPNGAGKSTLLKGMMGLVKSDHGTTLVGSHPISEAKKHIAYVEQRSAIDLTFPITVEEVVLLGTFPKLGLFHRPKKADKERVLASLELVKMTEFKKRQIGELSGGQLQRVFIARALAQDAEIIFLDEPFVGIDMTSEKVIIDLLKELKAIGKTIVIVHHDLHKVIEYFDELVIINKELVSYGPVATSFTTTNIQKAYGDTMGSIIIKGVGA